MKRKPVYFALIISILFGIILPIAFGLKDLRLVAITFSSMWLILTAVYFVNILLIKGRRNLKKRLKEGINEKWGYITSKLKWYFLVRKGRLQFVMLGLYVSVVCWFFTKLGERVLADKSIYGLRYIFTDITNWMGLFLIVFFLAMVYEIYRLPKENYGLLAFLLDSIELFLAWGAFSELGILSETHPDILALNSFFAWLIPIPILVNLWNLSVRIYDGALWILGTIFSCLLFLCYVYVQLAPWLVSLGMLIASIIGLIIYQVFLND